MSKTNFYTHSLEDERQKLGFYDEKLEFILKKTGKNKKVLDIGCNDGYVGEKLIAQRNTVYGIDIVERDLQTAKKRGLKVMNIDIENNNLPYEDNYFDVIILADIIEHVFDTDLLLRKCFKVLKKNGTLILTTPNIASLGRRLMLMFGKSPYVEHSLELSTSGLPSVGHIRYYTETTLAQQLKYNNYREIKTEGNTLNVGVLRSKKLGRKFPSLSTMLMVTCRKNISRNKRNE